MQGFSRVNVFIDGFLHHLVLQLLKTKDEAFKLTKSYFERAEVQTGERANILCSNGGGEYGSRVFFRSTWSIHHKKQIPTHFRRVVLPNAHMN
ncbi:hypothetical protein EV702DRAFT_977338 [Suillus placidus]|uniref:Uncharacterized protein n=1 Tax=Suillus placidus TaxID=48579 RepID=A0A9P6ZLM0_9AGAM|nr:hypothetical protein EV702DRAFT_977338 [Suillus placidus]